MIAEGSRDSSCVCITLQIAWIEIENMLKHVNFTKTPINCKMVFTLHEVFFKAIRKRDISFQIICGAVCIECFISFLGYHNVWQHAEFGRRQREAESQLDQSSRSETREDLREHSYTGGREGHQPIHAIRAS